MAFYGESWPIFDLVNVRGGVAFEALTFHYDDQVTTLGGGTTFVVSVASAPLDVAALQDAADDVVVSWVIEVGDNSDGSVALTSGRMARSATLSEDYATEPLGTFAAVGAGRIVAGPTTISGADLLDFTRLSVLRVECTGGPVEVRQVKLRVWPSGGALGAWVTGTGMEVHGAARIMDSEPLSYGSPQVATYERAWSLAKAAVSTWHGTMVDWLEKPGQGGSMQTLWVAQAQSAPPFLPVGVASMGMTILSALPPIATTPGPKDVDAGIDPNEIVDEPTAQVRTAEGVPVQTVFAGWPYPDAGVQLSSQSGQIAMRRRLEPHFTPSSEHLGWFTETFEIPPMNGQEQSGGMLLPLLNEEHQTIAAYCPLYYALEVAEEDTLSGTTLEVIAPYSLAVATDYLYYSPTAVQTRERPPRFFVTYTEVDSEPHEVSHVVGIGKPADDASIFRVPTPLGTLRELRHGEAVADVSVAYPLKVKLYDGSWTVVAGMTPDA